MAEIARQINPLLLGWIGYYGRFSRSALYSLVNYVPPAHIIGQPKRSSAMLGSYCALALVIGVAALACYFAVYPPYQR